MICRPNPKKEFFAEVVKISDLIEYTYFLEFQNGSTCTWLSEKGNPQNFISSLPFFFLSKSKFYQKGKIVDKRLKSKLTLSEKIRLMSWFL